MTFPEQLANDLGIAPEHQPILTAIAQLVDAAVAKHTEHLVDEVSRLRVRVERPDLQKYTVDEACDRLKRSRSSVYDLMQRGSLVPIKEAGRTYITEEEIQRWERVQRN